MNYKNLIEEGVTMVLPMCFETIVNHESNIAKLKGDIIECGVWKGGFSIFLADTFKDKTIWVADSFDGFQPLSESTYEYAGERHDPNYNSIIKVSLEEVQSNFKKYNLEGDRIKFLKGFVKDTLPTSGIQNIVPGGYIIFDDACLHETLNAIKTFFKRKNIASYLIHPSTDEVLSLDLDAPSSDSTYPTGCYIIKQ